MAVSKVGKFDLMYQFVAQHKFEMDGNVPDKLRCGQCKKLFINPHIGSCLCKLCRDCIDNMLANGIDTCPGIKDDCKEERITQFFPDYITSSKISKLVLKCPNELCQYKCEIMKMEEHFRLCSSKCVECPFFGLGCNADKLLADKICDHLQLQGYNHNRILIEMIGDLRNELKESDERNKQELQRNKSVIQTVKNNIKKNKDQLEILKENLRMKDETIAILDHNFQQYKTQFNGILKDNDKLKQINDETIAKIQDDIKSIKMDHSRMNDQTIVMINEQIQKNKDQIEILTGNFSMNAIAKIQEEIKSIKEERQQMAAQTNNLKIELENKIANLTVETTKACQNSIEKRAEQTEEEVKKLQMQLLSSTDGVDECPEKLIKALFSWKVNHISDKRRKYTNVTSEIFYPITNPYKMQLGMLNYPSADKLQIQLRIYAGQNDANLEWPFQRNVTIQISNNTHPEVSTSITKYCTISQPFTQLYNHCETFFFSYAKLSAAGLMQDNNFIIYFHME